MTTRTTGDVGAAGTFAVESATEPGLSWDVLITAPGVHWCGCPSFSFKHGCRHSQEADEALIEERTRLDEARRADPQYRARLIERAREIERMFA